MGWFQEKSLGLVNWAWITILLVLVVILVVCIVLVVLKKKKDNKSSAAENKDPGTITVSVGKESAEKMEQSPVTVKAQPEPEQPAKEANAEQPVEKVEPAEEVKNTAEEKAEPVVVVLKDGKTEEKSQPAKVQAESATVAAAKTEEEKVKEKQPAKAQPAPAKAQPAPAKAQPAPAKAQPAPAKAQPAPAKAQPAPAKAQPAAKPATKTYHISLRKSDGMWQVKAANAEKAIKLFNTQAEAIEYCKTLADNQEANIMIHKKDGSFRKLTY